MKKVNNFLICLAIALMMSCFLFNTTVAKDTEKSGPRSTIKKIIIKEKTINAQQKEIKVRMKRIEKKIIKRRDNKRNNEV